MLLNLRRVKFKPYSLRKVDSTLDTVSRYSLYHRIGAIKWKISPSRKGEDDQLRT